MDKLKINVAVAGRNYPMNIERTDEESIRNAVSTIDKMVKSFESKYAVRDKQDVLAMCCVQFASKLEKLQGRADIDDEQLQNQLEALDDILSEALRSR